MRQRAGEDDTSEIQSRVGWAELPELNAHEFKVRLVYTVTGFALLHLDDGMEITEWRSLTQQDHRLHAGNPDRNNGESDIRRQ
jgi:hypothetical protein